MLRQQTVEDGVPADVTIEGAVVTNGETAVVFDCDACTLSISGLTVASLTAEALIASANGATSTLSDATIDTSSLQSVTTTTLGSVQRVEDTSVSSMLRLEDAFFGTGSNTRVALTRTTVENNLLRERWRVLNVRDGAQGNAVETTIARNSAIQFGFTASSSRSIMTVDDSFFVDNFGLGVSLLTAVG